MQFFLQVKRIGNDWSDFGLSIKRVNDRNWENVQESSYCPVDPKYRIMVKCFGIKTDLSESELKSDSEMSEITSESESEMSEENLRSDSEMNVENPELD